MGKIRNILKTGAGIAGVLAAAAVYTGQIEVIHHIPEAKSGQKKIACVGDSITYGCFVGGQPWNSYPARLGRMLGSGYCVANFGYTNRTAIADADFPYISEKLYGQSLRFRPDIVVLMLGTNDTKSFNWNAGKFRRDLGRLIDSYRELDSHPEVFVLLPVPAAPFMGKVRWDIDARVLEEEVIPICREVAAEKHARIADVHGAFRGRESLLVDGIHPNRVGAEIIARTVYEALKGAAAV